MGWIQFKEVAPTGIGENLVDVSSSAVENVGSSTYALVDGAHAWNGGELQSKRAMDTPPDNLQ